MKRGSRTRPWTTADEAALAELAGTVPVREICARLRRSRHAVYKKAQELRKRGLDVQLRTLPSADAVCPSCGNTSALIGRDGICEPCVRRRQLERIEARTAALMAELPPEQRAVYEATEAETGSSRAPYPPPPTVTACMTKYRRAKLRRDWLRECERVDAANLMREVKAAQKRKERIEGKVKIFKSMAKSD